MENIQKKVIEQEMKEAYIDYSMSVIVGRALPDVRDGLKPVHRRVLFAMSELGMTHNKPFKKSARIVGEVLGKFHPHGDTAVYDTIVRMAQDFSLRYPLIKGQGNWGNIDGDSAAAMRYCITGDSLILTDKGIMPIQQISNKNEEKINLIISNFKGVKTKASKFFNSGQHKTIKITTKEGYSIEGSFNHPILCWNIDEFNCPKLSWKLLSEISTKDFVLLSRNSNLYSKKNLQLKLYYPKISKKEKFIELPKEMNKDLAFLLGALVSEGAFHQNQILFNNKDQRFYNKVKDIIESQFKGIKVYERKIKGDCTELSIYNKRVVNFLINIGLTKTKANKKEIPFSILMSKKVIIKEFLIALFEGDGCVEYKIDKRHQGKSIILSYCSQSIKLINQLKTVLLNFGIITSKQHFDKRGKGCYKILLPSKENIIQFQKQIGFYSKRKKMILDKANELNEKISQTDSIPYISNYLRMNYKSEFIIKNNIDRYNQLNKNYDNLKKILNKHDISIINWLVKNKPFFNKIETIEANNEKEVYSIRVDSKCHSFVANGFINHNTEAKLSKISEELLIDLNRDTVDFQDNFDASLKEPIVLPAKLPNLLINGSTGIAVGMATNIPPHNLKETCSAIIQLIDKPESSTLELMQHIKGPDFPTGGIICGKAGIASAFNTGRGKVQVRAKVEIEQKKDRQRILVTEIPYQVNKSVLIENIASLVNNKVIEGISDIRDESDRDGMSIVIELKKGNDANLILNQLYKHTQLETTFGIILLALDHNKPKVMTLKEILTHYINHRKEVIIRRTRFDLNKAEQRAHILEGLQIALSNIDAIVKGIKSSKTVEIARNFLTNSFKLTEAQSNAILDLKLQKLTSLETEKLLDELKQTIELIKELNIILSSEQKVLDLIKVDLQNLIESYGDNRKTEIQDQIEELETEDLIPNEDVSIILTRTGYIKRMSLEEYRIQKRGGVGVKGTEKKEEDDIESIITASTHNYLLCFSSSGQVYWLKVYKIPESGKYAKGKAIINLLNLKPNDRITTVIPIKEFAENHYLLMCTKKGLLKKTLLTEYSNPRKGGIVGIKLREDDELVTVKLTPGTLRFMIGTKKGNAVRFDEKDVRDVGRNSQGVKGITLEKNDEVIGMEVAIERGQLLTVTENGFGKRTDIPEYRLISRGGKGVINIQTTDRNGDVVAIKTVKDDDEIIVASKNGIVIRIQVSDIAKIGRNTQGVRIMKLKEGDKVSTVERIKYTNGKPDESNNEDQEDEQSNNTTETE